MVICLERGGDLHMAQLLPLPLSLASVKSRLVLRFSYWLTRTVLEKRLLNYVCVFITGPEDAPPPKKYCSLPWHVPGTMHVDL